MQWNKQTEANLNGWLGTQQKLYENWWNMVATPPATMQMSPTSLPSLDSWFSAIAEQWRTFAQQNATTLMPELMNVTRVPLEQFLASQQHTQHLMQMTADAWSAIMAKAISPDEWSQALTGYAEQMRQQLTKSLDSYKLVQSGSELWQLYGEEMMKLSLPWFNYWLQTQQQLGQAVGQRNGASTWAELTNLFWDAFNQTAGRLVGVPSMGLLREFNEKMNRGFIIWQENQQAGVEYQGLVTNTWVDAFEAFMQKLLDLARAGETIDSQDKLLDLWVEVADEQFIALFHSDTFTQIQSKYINSSMALRRQQRELSEVWLRMNDLPTRSEINEAHHAIFQLRQEVKTLKKAVHDMATAAPEDVTGSDAKSTKRRPAKAKTATGAADPSVEKVVAQTPERAVEEE